MLALAHPDRRSVRSVLSFQPSIFVAIGWVLFGLCWLLPNHYNPWLNFPSEAMAFSAIAMLMMGALATLKPESINYPALLLWVAGVASVPWIQWALGINTFAGDALLVSYFIVGWAVAIFVGYHVADEQYGLSVSALMQVVWIVALLSAMVGLLQWLKLEGAAGIYIAQTDVGDPAMGNLAQPNQLATLLLMGIVAYTYFFERRIIGRFTFVLGLSVLTAVLVLTHSRAGMLGVAVIGGFFFMKRNHIASRISPGSVVAWVIMFAMGIVISPDIDRALMLYAEREPLFTSNGRALIWAQALEGTRRAPWFGYGWDQTFAALSVGSLAHPGESVFTHAHNVLLDVLAWNGIPLGITLIGMGGYWFFTRLHRVNNLAGIYAMACLLPFLAHSMVEFPFAYAYFLLTAGLMIGLVERSLEPTGLWHIPRIWGGTSLLIWVAIGGGIAYEYLLIEEDVRVTRFENLRVGATDTDYQAPRVWLLSQMATMQRAVRQQPVPNMTESQLEDMRRATTRFPHGGLALRYAMALALNGDPVGASHILAVIRGVYGQRFYDAAEKEWDKKADRFPQLKAIPWTK